MDPDDKAVLDKLVATGNINGYSFPFDGGIEIEFIDGMKVQIYPTSDQCDNAYVNLEEVCS